IDVLSARSILESFESAWKDRVTTWQTALPFLDQPTPEDFVFDSNDLLYVRLRHEEGGVSFVSFRASQKRGQKPFEGKMDRPWLIDLKGRAAVAGFLPDRRKFLITNPAGKEIGALDLPEKGSELYFAGC